MSGGGELGANAELGIGIQDALAANARMEGKDGLTVQHKWSITYLNERVMGMGAVLLSLVVSGAYYTDAFWPYLETAAGMGLVGLAVLTVMHFRRKRALNDLRERQVREHRAKPRESKHKEGITQ